MPDSVRRLADLRNLVAAGSGRSIPPQNRNRDSLSIEAISGGSVPEFVAVFDRTSEVVRAEVDALVLPGWTRADEVFAASYVEVWWLAGCHAAPPVDILRWITSIVRRRLADAQPPQPRATNAGWPPGAIPASRPSYAELELAALLGRPIDHLTQT
jgi:hypothetical protein